MGKTKTKGATIEPSSEPARCDASEWPLLLKVRQIKLEFRQVEHQDVSLHPYPGEHHSTE